MIDQVRFCSQSYESLQLTRRLEPKVRVGYIAANALGDLARLDVDFLMVKTDLATRRLVERAGARTARACLDGQRSLVAGPLARPWRGIVITDYPARCQRLAAIQAFSPVERLLLRGRSALTD